MGGGGIVFLAAARARGTAKGLSDRPFNPSFITGSIASCAKTGSSTGLKKAIPFPKFAVRCSGRLARRGRCKSGFGSPHAPHVTQYFTTWIGNPLLSPRDAATGARRDLPLARNERGATRGGGRKKEKTGAFLRLEAPSPHGTCGFSPPVSCAAENFPGRGGRSAAVCQPTGAGGGLSRRAGQREPRTMFRFPAHLLFTAWRKSKGLPKRLPF